ncbi:MAG: MATE family efflux transporter, partial [Pseudomonadota bacterium]|nr:MATE family efflux transporter [Pseudomonadota bacterium]
ICGLLITIPDLLIGFFLQENETSTIDIATRFIFFFWPAFIFSGLNITLSEYFTACQKPLHSASIAVSRSLLLPLIFLITLPIWLDEIGIYIAIPLAEFFAFLLALTLITKNKPKKLVEALAHN